MNRCCTLLGLRRLNAHGKRVTPNDWRTHRDELVAGCGAYIINCGCSYRSYGHLAPFRCTRVARMIPPQLARALLAAGAILLQSFFVLYRREASRLSAEKAEDGREGRWNSSSPDQPLMTPAEAVAILGVAPPKATSHESTSPAAAYALPLTDRVEREKARESFHRMFRLAMDRQNYFLAGKLSAAYRMCVDENWDSTEDDEDSTTDMPGGANDREEITTEQGQRPKTT